jgi:hypothetical protein
MFRRSNQKKFSGNAALLKATDPVNPVSSGAPVTPQALKSPQFSAFLAVEAVSAFLPVKSCTA